MTPQPTNPEPSESAGARARAGRDAHLERVLDLIRFLRVHCPWDARQTAESLLPHLLEEAHEVAAAVRAGSPPAELAAELGDLLLNVGYQIVVSEEDGGPDAEAVTAALEAKMVRRHPHVDWTAYPRPLPEPASAARSEVATREAETDEAPTETDRAPTPGPASPPAEASASAASWENRKRAERGPDASALDGVPAALEPLARAHRVQERAAAVGFDWDDTEGPAGKVAEELEEVRDALTARATPLAADARLSEDPGTSGDPEDIPTRVADELGDLLFAVVNLARRAGVHPSTALARATAKFERRFRTVEDVLAANGRTADALSLAELDAIWDRVKQAERSADR